MNKIKLAPKTKKIILALGPESAGNFSIYKNSELSYFSDFGDLLDEKNFVKFKRTLNNELIGVKPDIIITDLHPLYKTTELGKKLAEKYQAKHIQVQHHIAHIFSQIDNSSLLLPLAKGEIERGSFQNSFFGIALDGTGYGLDGKIWGGEVFECRMSNVECRIERIGHLENQIMIGGELAVREPARMLLAILARIRNQELGIRDKEFVYDFVKNHYNQNQFNLLYNQMQQNFNCVETSSAGRILDAVSVLLGFAGNERNYKHEAASLLEMNSGEPYTDIKPKIQIKKQVIGHQSSVISLSTTYLFKYLIKNLHKDKRRLAATAQMYIAQGVDEIIKKQIIYHQAGIQTSKPGTDYHQEKNKLPNIFLSGGISDNKIISNYFQSRGAYQNKKIPRGDAGLSLGQIAYFLFFVTLK